MARRFGDKDVWIELPDEWVGDHARRRDKAYTEIPDGTGVTESNFMLALALLDNWQLPGLTGRIESWDFAQIPLPLIAWVSQVTLTDYNRCFQVKKNYSRQ
jgi:hypothetical protein